MSDGLKKAPSGATFSVVVPTLQEHYDASVLGGLRCPNLCEVIIVSQHPGAATGDETYASMRIRRIRIARRGTSIARNCGLRLAAGDAVVFIDDDVIPNADYARLIIDSVLADQCDLLLTACHYGTQWPTTNDRSFRPARTYRDALGSGTGIAVRRAAVEGAGIWFDEGLGGGQPIISGEDNVFTLTAWRRGLRVSRSSFRSVLHPATGSTGWRTDSVFLRSLAFVLRRHYGPHKWYVAARTALRILLKNREPLAALTFARYFMSPPKG